MRLRNSSVSTQEIRWPTPTVLQAIRCAVFGAIAISVVGCTGFPKEGPNSDAIASSATVKVAAEKSQTIFNYVLIDIDQKAISDFGAARSNSLYGTFGNAPTRAPEIRLGVGDVVQVTVFEAQSGGLFVPMDAGARPGNYVTFPSQQIDGRGEITVPYAGSVRASGRSIGDVQAEIVKRLANRAIEPQALVTLATQRSSQVSVLGDVKAPARIDVNPAGDKIIDVLARAGGPSYPGYETFVTLERNQRRSTVFFDDIIANPRENIFVRPDDAIYVLRDPAYFIAFGATNAKSLNTSSKVDFGASHLSLAEGLAKVGGIDDMRADSRKVFIYRMVDRAALQRAGINVARFSPVQTSIPVIFQANFANPSVYFAAQSFALRNKDVLYVDNSGSYEVTKFLTLISSAVSPAASVRNTVD